MNKILKAQYANDIFTTPEEARSRSMDMGLNGDIHVSDYNEQAVYMPAVSEDAYVAYYEQVAGIPTEEEEDTSVDRIEALRAIVAEVIGKKMTTTNIEGKILKTDDEQRLVYGWASVVTEKGEPVVDRQGDVIEADTLVKAVNEFMEHVRVGKAMHTGEQVGTIVHSLPITKEIGEALGIQTNREGWVVAYKVYDDAVWDMVKSGELAAFSIGGRAMKEEI
jgi:phosphohistidine swiveling domain-containing protein